MVRDRILTCFFYVSNSQARSLLICLRYKQAAAKGDVDAKYCLGLLHESLPEQAFHWYLQAAEAEFVLAQMRVADAYAFGRGTRKAPSESAKWYQRASACGHELAHYQLGMSYRDGSCGVSRNDQEAARLLLLAAQSGFPQAQAAVGKYAQFYFS
jgi:hypothetical protein